MQKIYFSLLVALGLCACGNQPSTNPTATADTTTAKEQSSDVPAETKEEAAMKWKIEWKDSSFVAVSYIGYEKTIDEIKASEPFKNLALRLPQLNKIDEIAVKAQGEELYLIVPRDKDAKVTVYEYTFEMATKEKPEKSGKVYYKSETGSPFIVKGNISDICPNMQIELTSRNGESYTFSPSLSLENGKLSVAKGMQELE